MKLRVVLECPTCGRHRVVFLERQCQLCQALDAPKQERPVRAVIVLAIVMVVVMTLLMLIFG